MGELGHAPGGQIVLERRGHRVGEGDPGHASGRVVDQVDHLVRRRGELGQASGGVVPEAGHGACRSRVVGKRNPVANRVIAVGEHDQRLHPAQARGGGHGPVETVIAEGQVAVAVNHGQDVADRIVAERYQVVWC